MEEKIVNTAFENLEKHTGIKGKYTNTPVHGMDGKVDFLFANGKETFIVEVKKEVRNHQLATILAWAGEYPNLLVIAENIFPAIKEELRKNNIAYLDAAGNIFLHTANNHLWIEGRKVEKTTKEKVNRAFTPTGIKVIFLFLLNEDLINAPQRTIAFEAGVALGNINYVINGLKNQKYLIAINKNKKQLLNKDQLLEKWMAAYEEKLKPALRIANFRFRNEDDPLQWKKIDLKQNHTWWGGENAGALITKYLNPEIFTLYTDEPINDLIKNYHLIPDPEGNVKVYRRFWHHHIDFKQGVVHPLLAYADLMNTGNSRCIETAKIIYDTYIKPNL